jgi:uncharacterized protein (DUF1800 family)
MDSTSPRQNTRAAAAHVLNRLAYGPRPGDIESVRAAGVDRYIDEQLANDAPEPAVAAFELGFETIQYSPSEVVVRHQRDNGSRASIECVLDDLRTCKLFRAVAASNQLREVLTDFWYNHFNVYAYAWEPSIPAYERETIRPHVLGKFRDLLRAVAKSPAMMYFLDTFVSTAKGVNENYGRELLELHTVGVTAGYTQHDVYEASRCFTGWDFGGWHAPVYSYRFAPDNHDENAKSIFGLALQRGGGESDGDRLIDFLAAHPKTARFISWRLAQRFVSDDPPESVVEKASEAFLATDGDIRSVLATIFRSDEFWAATTFRSKTKSPLEFVASAMRAVNASVKNGKAISTVLGNMGMPLFECKPPTGYSNRSTDWISAASTVHRFNFVLALATGAVPGTQVAIEKTTGAEFADRIFGIPLSRATLSVLDRVTAGGAVSREAKLSALLLASPEFQSR